MLHYRSGIAILLLSLWVFLPGLLHAQTVYEEEVRGVWITNVDSDVLTSKQKIAEAMDYLADNGINVVFPVVWNKGVTQYPSDVMVEYFGSEYRQDNAFRFSERDPLQEIIVEAHRNGMEVIPWFEYGFAYLYSGTGFGPTENSHIADEYPGWLAKNSDGITVKKNGFEWMNAIHGDVQEFMLKLIEEVIQNYDIDGIQGDDRLPAMAAEAGYSDYTVTLYKDEHGGDAPPSNYNNSNFMQWKADKLTEFGTELYNRVKAIDPTLIVSLSPSIYPFSYNNYLQDWPEWLERNQVDIIHPQAYRYNVSDYKDIIYSMIGGTNGIGYVDKSYVSKISPGILTKAGSRFNGPEYVIEAVKFNRERNIDGEVYFFYEGMGERNNYLADSLSRYVYTRPALLPYREGKVRRPGGIIVNETDPEAEVNGAWEIGDTPVGFNDRSLKAEKGSSASITYAIDVPYEAWYHITAYIPEAGDEATQSAYYQISGENDTSAVRFNQQEQKNHGWVMLGSVYLEQGLQRPLTIYADSVQDNGITYADAAMLLLDRKQSPDVEIDAMVTNLEESNPEAQLPESKELITNYPNPFNPTTTIQFSLSSPHHISIEVYSVHGQLVRTLANNQPYSSGEHRLNFSAGNLASGIYMVRLIAEGRVIGTHRITLIK